jgi:hypothetical protein
MHSMDVFAPTPQSSMNMCSTHVLLLIESLAASRAPEQGINMTTTTTTTDTTTTEVAEAPVANLRETKRAAAAAKKQAAAEPKAEAPAKASGSKLKWTLDGERDERNRVGQTAVAPSGATYVISGSDMAWTLVVTPKGGKAETVKEGGHTACYQAAVKHHAAKA